MALVMLAGCGNPVISSAPQSPADPTNAPPSRAAPSDARAPAQPAPDATIDAFLVFARSPDQSFSVAISGEYTIGSHHVAYDLTGARSGPDAIERGTETFDGKVIPIGAAFVDGQLYSGGTETWSHTDASAEAIAAYAGGLLSFSRALVLHDLGRDPATGHYRLHVAAGFSLFPPQMTTLGTPDAHDVTERLEILVTDAGLPVEATYSRSIAGTIDGVAGTSSGSVRFTFSDVGGSVNVAVPSLAPGVTLPPAASTTQAPPAVDWQSRALAHAPFSIEVPGTPTVTSGTVAIPNLGNLDQTMLRLDAPDGGRYSAIETALPAAYIRDRGPTAVAEELVATEASHLGATVVGQRPLVGTEVSGADAILATASGLFRIRVYVFADDTVELGVAGNIDAVATAAADRFLGSLGPRT